MPSSSSSSSLSLPENVSKILDSLSASDQETMLAYIASLKGGGDEAAAATAADTAEPMQEDNNNNNNDTSGGTSSTSNVPHPKYDATSNNNEDFELAGDLKQQAADAKSSGDLEKALELYNQAVLAAPPSALLYANRAMVLEQMGHYVEAVDDCTYALEINPDSSKALKVRGKIRYQHLENKDWHGALSDLNQAQAMDFDPDVADLLKELTELRKHEELEQAQARIQKEEELKKKAADIKKAKQEARQRAAAEDKQRSSAGAGAGAGPAGGMPGGMPGGMDPSMMAGLMSDPEIQQAMKNPKVVQAFQELMSGPGGPMGLLNNPAKLTQLMSDPEVGPVLQKLMSKFAGGGVGGGGGGMPGMGMPSGGGGGGADADGGADDIPDMEEMPDLD